MWQVGMQAGLETKLPELKEVLLWPNGERRQAVMLADQLRVRSASQNLIERHRLPKFKLGYTYTSGRNLSTDLDRFDAYPRFHHHTYLSAPDSPPHSA